MLNIKYESKYYEDAIALDTIRTITNSEDKKLIGSLTNLLVSYSRRNPYLGYC